MSVLTAYDKFIQQALKYGFSLWGPAKTGQTTSYRTGDDGDLEKGYPKDPPRFKDNEDGTITDMATGLMWVRKPDTTHRTWNDAIDYCLALDYAGHTDWHLPNINELASLLFYGALLRPWMKYYLNDHYFYVPANPFYWSSTRPDQNTTEALAIDFSTGKFWEHDPTWTKKLRPVRSN